MSHTLRISIIIVLTLAATALGLIAYNANAPRPVVSENVQAAAQPAPSPVRSAYIIAAHSLPAGTLARDEDFATRAATSAEVPPGAIPDTPEARIELRGAMVRTFLDTGHPITSQDILRPRDRGFLASVLAPDTRAISINVDSESGVSGLIWPGDYVDVVLTQVGDKANGLNRAMTEIVLHNVRIIAIDQEIVQGIPSNNAAAGKPTRSVSLQLSPEQVKKITLAKDMGKLSLAVRSAVEQNRTVDAGTMFGCEVSPEIARQGAIARQSTTVQVFGSGKIKDFSVKNQNSDSAALVYGCDPSAAAARQGTATASIPSDTD